MPREVEQGILALPFVCERVGAASEFELLNLCVGYWCVQKRDLAYPHSISSEGGGLTLRPLWARL